MKRTILGWLAAGILAVPMSAQALLVTVDGQQWEITTLVTTFDASAGTLTAQPWWDDEVAAAAFANAWGAAQPAIGSPYFAAFFNDTPVPRPCYFTQAQGGQLCLLTWTPGASGGYLDSLPAGPEGPAPYAIAAPVSVPEPGPLLLFVSGLVALLGRKRRRLSGPAAV